MSDEREIHEIRDWCEGLSTIFHVLYVPPSSISLVPRRETPLRARAGSGTGLQTLSTPRGQARQITTPSVDTVAYQSDASSRQSGRAMPGHPVEA